MPAPMCSLFFVLFFYDIFPNSRELMAEIGIQLHYSPPGGTCWRSPRRAAISTPQVRPRSRASSTTPASWSGKHGGISSYGEQKQD